MIVLETIMLLLICVLISAVIDQFVPRISSPLIQVGLGLACALIFKNKIDVEIDTTLFMILFIAPLLYNEAQNANKTMMAKNRGAILSLAIGLVLFSTFFVGFTLNAILPSVSLAAALALGAALGPTDAVAVTSLPEDVKIGKRIEGVLKGECLLNDASGIVCFQFALIAATTGSFDPGSAGITFLTLFVGGALLGVVLGFLSLFILNRVKDLGLDNTTFHVLFDISLPFIIYIISETLHVSGIIAVVAAGIVKSFSGNKVDPIMSKTNIVSSSVWGVLVFAINGIVFVSMGFQIPDVMIKLWMDETIQNDHLILYVVAITFALCMCRFIWVLIMEHRRNPETKWCTKCKIHDSLLMTFGGPKGAVSLAIAMSIPTTLASGEPFPGRSTILFIAGGVIIITLVLANFLLPILMPKKLKKKAKAEQEKQDDLNAIMIEVLRSVIEKLAANITKENRHASENVIKLYTKRIENLKNNLNYDQGFNLAIREKAIEWEREFVNHQLKEGKFTTHIAFKYLKRLSRRQDLLTHRTSLPWVIRNNFARAKNFIKNLPKRTKNIAQKNLYEPGETAQINTAKILQSREPIADIDILTMATINHVIDRLNSEIANGSVEPTEDISNLIEEYRQHLFSLQSKSPSLTAISDLKSKEDKIIFQGISWELQEIQELYSSRKITYDQLRNLSEQVHLIQVSFEEF